MIILRFIYQIEVILLKLKQTAAILVILTCFITLNQIYLQPGFTLNVQSNGYYQESTIAQGINLTVGVNSRELEWDENLTISIFVLDGKNNSISSSNVLLQLSTVSYVHIYYNMSLPFYFWTQTNIVFLNRIPYYDVSVSDGFKEILTPIPHVPTQQSYTLIAIFRNATQTGPNVTYTLFISSDRAGIITFELFFFGYIGLIITFGAFYVLYRKGIIRTVSNSLKVTRNKS